MHVMLYFAHALMNLSDALFEPLVNLVSVQRRAALAQIPVQFRGMDGDTASAFVLHRTQNIAVRHVP